jgi:DNA-directed RNA polymerase subunit RPC12/RpoP
MEILYLCLDCRQAWNEESSTARWDHCWNCGSWNIVMEVRVNEEDQNT